MIHLFINATAASAGGGLTYVRNVLPRIACRDDVRATVLVPDSLRSEIGQLTNIEFPRKNLPAGSAKRFWQEQLELPRLIRRSGADVLLSTGNFALLRSPAPQILLSRNALYTSADFQRDLQQRGDYRLWIDNQLKAALARWSIAFAECTVAPSESFAQDLRRLTGRNVRAIHHGFDPGTFLKQGQALPLGVQAQLAAAADSIRILFVSHYNYYRNFESLIRAVGILKRRLRPRTVRLFLTCKLRDDENPGPYAASPAANLVRGLGLTDEIIQLGSVPYPTLHYLYSACHLYVTPAYAETFAHPLVEAMAIGLPVIASDLAVHREICGEAAVYFPRFSAEALAEKVMEAERSKELLAAMSRRGLARSLDFSWDKHLDQLLLLAQELIDARALRL